MSKIEKARAEPNLIIPIGLGLTLLLATWLRFYRLAGQSLWSDEGNSLALAQVGLGEITVRTALDIHPPLYYWLLHGWIQVFGESEAPRALQRLPGVLLVAMVYRLGTQLFNKWVGLLGAFIAPPPFQVYFGKKHACTHLGASRGADSWATAGLMAVVA
jgi:predicted membrane-bound mannosyltransferase